MLRESSVIAVAGTRKLLSLLSLLFCGALSATLLIFGALKVLGLLGSMAMLTMDGVVSSEDLAANVSTHVFFTIIVIGFGLLFAYWARLAMRSLAIPFEQDIIRSAEIVDNVESNARANSVSLRDAAKSALAKAQDRHNIR